MKNLLIILLSACVGGLLSMMLTRSCQVEPPLPEMMVLRDTITEVHIDTFTAYKPLPYKVTVKDTIRIADTLVGTTLVQEVKEYKDSTYYARISGINAYLEEIKVYPKTITQYINTKEYVYIPPKKWSIGIQGGIGITPKGLQPYLGVGVSRRLEF